MTALDLIGLALAISALVLGVVVFVLPGAVDPRIAASTAVFTGVAAVLQGLRGGLFVAVLLGLAAVLNAAAVRDASTISTKRPAR